MSRFEQIIQHGLGIGRVIRGEYRVHRKALERFIVAKYAAEEIVGFLDFVVLLSLVIENPDPGADTRQRPYIALSREFYSIGCEALQHANVQSCRRTTPAEANRPLERPSFSLVRHGFRDRNFLRCILRVGRSIHVHSPTVVDHVTKQTPYGISNAKAADLDSHSKSPCKLLRFSQKLHGIAAVGRVNDLADLQRLSGQARRIAITTVSHWR